MPTAFPAAAVASDAVAETTVRALFHITATAEAGLLPRLVDQVARLGLTPTRVHASRESGDGNEIVVDLRVGGLARPVAERMSRSLRAVLGVRHVISVLEAE